MERTCDARRPLTQDESDALQECLNRNRPYGSPIELVWVEKESDQSAIRPSHLFRMPPCRIQCHQLVCVRLRSRIRHHARRIGQSCQLGFPRKFDLLWNLAVQAEERQRSPGRGERHCFQKPRSPRLRVHRTVITRLAFA